MSETQIIYDIIHKAGPIARIDISSQFKKRPATVTRITNKLLKQNIIYSYGKKIKTKGRALELLEVNPNAFHVLGIHAVSNGFHGCIVSAGGEMLSCFKTTLQHKHSKQGFLEDLHGAIKYFLDSARKDKITISGIGLALPGEVDYKNGHLLQAAVILPGLVEVPCKKYIEDSFQLPTTVDHDATMMTFGEYLWGKSRTDCSSMGTLFIGHGIGGRFVINGQLFRGGRNRAGELGHIPLRRDGPVCKCGLRGCFEALASIPVIEKNYGKNNSFAEIVNKAEAGEKRAIEVLHEAAKYMGEALAIIFDIIDVELMVINGDIIAAEALIKDILLDSLRTNSHSKQPSDKEFLRFSNYGSEAGAMGAAAVITKRIFADFGIVIK